MALVDGMIRAARLDTSLYEEVEKDTTETQNALIVVVIAAVASGIATAVSTPGGNPILGLIAGVVASVVAWAVVSGFVYLIGTRVFGGTATWGEVMRTVGYANSVGVLNILGVIPVLGGLIRAVVAIWVIVTTVVAIRQALDVSTGKAIISAVLGWLLGVICTGIILGIFAVPYALMNPGAMTAP
jgi:hypothetical protein